MKGCGVWGVGCRAGKSDNNLKRKVPILESIAHPMVRGLKADS